MKENDSLVSVIIPVYNVEPFLRDAMDSVIGQTYQDLEIIVVDDGSTDGSGRICDDYAAADHRIIVIHQQNKGLSGARNTGLDIMRGRLVAFLDSDDVLHRDYISSMVSAMSEDEPDMVVCKYTNMGQDDTKTHPAATGGMYTRESALRALATNLIDISAWNKLYKRELFDAIRYPEGHNYEDADTTYRIIDICGKVCVLDSPLYYHRQNPGSITSTFTWKNISDRILAYSHFLAYIESNTPSIFSREDLDERRRQTIAAYISNFASTYRIKSGDRDTQENVRKLVIEAGRNCGIGNCRLKTRAGYWITAHCPWMFRLFYPVYHRLRFKSIYCKRQ